MPGAITPIILTALLGGPSPPEPPLSEADRRHWAFRPVRASEIPPADGRNFGRSPVDAFVRARLAAGGLDPAPPADRATLLRRLSFDLVGLPPPPEEVDAFLADADPDAYERRVDRLLASPHHGERWAQHWLDVVRYAESNGFELDATREHAWRYRDYVIDSLNADKPYDRFVTEQVAGDLLAGGRDPREAVELYVATGLHLCGPRHVVSGNTDKDELRYEMLTEMVTGVGNAFLGLTLQCARCHDHKFDPVSQADYYRMQAFFAGTQPRDVDIATPAQRQAFELRLLEVTLELKPVKAAISKIDAPVRERLTERKKAALEPKYRDALAVPAGERTELQKSLAKDAQTLIEVTWDEVLAGLTPEQKAERDRLRAQQHELEARLPIPVQVSAVAEEDDPPDTHLLIRGEVHDKGPRVRADVPRLFRGADPQSALRDSPSPDRLDLARWLTSDANPLTARVIVNRLWQHHFGRGIVETPNDFGRRGAKPTHPRLLDFLAAELVRGGWGLKALHREMVTSATYRQSGDPRGGDPENRLFSRMDRARLEGESLRDAALAVAGTLNRQFGGRMVRVPLEPEVYDLIFTEGEPDGLWPVTPDPTQHRRRSVYLFAKRNVRLPLLEAFDQPDRLSPCGRRAESTFAPQALILMNGPFMRQRAVEFAARLLAEASGGDAALVDRAFRVAFSRPPRPEESAAALEFLRGRARPAAVADLALALLNTNEFLYVR